MRRKKHSDRGGGGGGGGELFICFTSRPSTASSGLRPSASSKAYSPGRDTAPAVLRPSLSRRLRNSGSLKGGQSPMFPPGTTAGRRGRGGPEPAEPSSPKVTCIGQVRVKGGKRKPKHAASAAALRSRSRRGVGGGSEASSFRRGVDDRGDGPGGKNQNQGWVYQIPVNICEALKTFGSCGGRSLCSPSRERPRSAGGAGDKKRRRAPAGGSWLCGAAMARCLLAIQEEDDEVGKGSAVGPADEARGSEVGLVMQGWDVEDEEEDVDVDDLGVVVGEVEVEKGDEILLVGGKEEEGRVSVCIPPRNALLLMRCRSDPVRMAALATRFWGSPAAANVGHVVDNEGDNADEEDEKEDCEHSVDQKDCEEEEAARNSTVDEAVCRDCGVVEDGGGEAGDAGLVEAEAEESSKHGDLGEEENGEEEIDDDPVVEVQIVRKDAGLDIASAAEAAKSESQVLGMVEVVADTKEDDGVPRLEKEQEDVKGRRSISSCSPSTALKEDRKLRRLGSKKRVSSSSRASTSSDRVDRRHSFSAEMEARRSSFSSLKDSRRASFSIDRDGRRWSFTIEQEHLVAEPKVLMASRKGKKNSSEPESEKDCPVLVVAPNSVEEAQESHDDGKEEPAKDDEEEGTAQGAEINTEVEKVETIVNEKEAVEVKQDRRKKSGELPDCLLMMMCEPKLSMEVSKETWVCSTDFVHWKSYQGQNRRQQKAAATGSNAAAASEENKESDNAQDTSVAKDTEESAAPAPVNSAPVPPRVVVPKPPPKPAMEKKLKPEPQMVAGMAVYAPLVLKRCKSEPLRSSARLAPDACFWKERHCPLNATGIGF